MFINNINVPITMDVPKARHTLLIFGKVGWTHSCSIEGEFIGEKGNQHKGQICGLLEGEAVKSFADKKGGWLVVQTLFAHSSAWNAQTICLLDFGGAGSAVPEVMAAGLEVPLGVLLVPSQMTFQQKPSMMVGSIGPSQPRRLSQSSPKHTVSKRLKKPANSWDEWCLNRPGENFLVGCTVSIKKTQHNLSNPLCFKWRPGFN